MYFYGEFNGLARYQSDDGGATFRRAAAGRRPARSYESAFGPGRHGLGRHQRQRRAGCCSRTCRWSGRRGRRSRTSTPRGRYYGAVGLDGATPVVIADERRRRSGSSGATSAGDVNDAPSLVGAGRRRLSRLSAARRRAARAVGAGGRRSRRDVRAPLRRARTSAPRVTIGPGDASEATLFQDAAGRLHARLSAARRRRLPRDARRLATTVSTWRVGELDVRPFDEQGTMRVAAAADHVGVAVWRAAGPAIVASRGRARRAVAQPPVAQPPPDADADARSGCRCSRRASSSSRSAGRCGCG